MSSGNGARRGLSARHRRRRIRRRRRGDQAARGGVEQLTLFERGDSVGGVWRANTYPGAACDVPSHLYSFSFAPGHHWSRRYAPQAEILTYLEGCARDFGITPHLRLNTEVTEARFDRESGRWTVTTDSGERNEFDLLVTACGQLTRPAVAPLAGIDDFDGPVFHSAEWDHEVDLAGRRVAVIGTGASAIQFVPEIAEVAASTAIYQRSAPWILPKSDRLYRAWERAAVPALPGAGRGQPGGPVRLLRALAPTGSPAPAGSWRRFARSPTSSAAASSATTRSCWRRRPPTTRSVASGS